MTSAPRSRAFCRVPCRGDEGPAGEALVGDNGLPGRRRLQSAFRSKSCSALRSHRHGDDLPPRAQAAAPPRSRACRTRSSAPATRSVERKVWGSRRLGAEAIRHLMTQAATFGGKSYRSRSKTPTCRRVCCHLRHFGREPELWPAVHRTTAGGSSPSFDQVFTGTAHATAVPDICGSPVVGNVSYINDWHDPRPGRML